MFDVFISFPGATLKSLSVGIRIGEYEFEDHDEYYGGVVMVTMMLVITAMVITVMLITVTVIKETVMTAMVMTVMVITMIVIITAVLFTAMVMTMTMMYQQLPIAITMLKTFLNCGA